MIIHADILLKADRINSWTNADIAAAYEVSTKKVEQLKKRFGEEGVAAALSRTSGTHVHRRKIPGDEAAPLLALGYRQAPEGQERWTWLLLADKMVAWDRIASVSHETIRRTLQRMHCNLGNRKHGVCHQSTRSPASVQWRKAEIAIKNRMMLHIPKCVWIQCLPNGQAQSVYLSLHNLASHCGMTPSRVALASARAPTPQWRGLPRGTPWLGARPLAPHATPPRG